MGKKIHLKVESVEHKITKIETELGLEETTRNKTKKKRLYAQLAKLRKALQAPQQHLVDPEEESRRAREDRQRRIQKKLERKRQEVVQRKKQKRYQKRCLKCGSREHKLADCGGVVAAQVVSASGFCFKCGSTEHSHRDCKEEKYNLAKCFYCGEQGHIARECVRNEKGMYRRGGSCFGCGSVRHTLKECPNRRQAGSTFDNRDQF